MMTSPLTIIMPLKGRPLFTLRFLWHADRARLPYKIILADGEVRPELAEMLENSRAIFPNLDVDYIRYPDDLNFSRFFAKMADALRRVTTPYAMLADNDDFLVSSGIERAINFLDANSDYVCCGGGVSGFSLYAPGNDSLAGVVGSLNKIAFRYAPADQSCDVGSASTAERLFLGLRTAWTYYSVIRAPALAAIHHDTAEMDLSDLQLHERFCTMRVLTLGKALSIPSAISYFRQYGTSMRSAFANDWVHHLVRSRFSTDFAQIIGRISQLAADGDNREPDQIADELRTRIEPWLSNFLRLNYGFSGSLRRHLRNNVPTLVSWLKTRRRYSVPVQRKSFFTKLRDNGATADYLATFRNELALIEDVVTGAAFRNFIRPFVGRLISSPSC
jgi:glycosyltransferase domain-containing protein